MRLFQQYEAQFDSVQLHFQVKCEQAKWTPPSRSGQKMIIPPLKDASFRDFMISRNQGSLGHFTPAQNDNLISLCQEYSLVPWQSVRVLDCSIKVCKRSMAGVVPRQ